MKNNKIYKCIIIGSGPAGYTAAIYTSRANLNPILFTGIEPGGQLMKTSKIENYPGFNKSIDGFLLMEQFKQQAIKFKTVIKNECIINIKINYKKSIYHKLYTNTKKEYLTKAVIIATGSSPKYLNIKQEQELIGKGISTCATCDGFFFKNETIAIVGGGDTALEESMYLSKLCKNIYIIVRKPYLKASKIMQNRILDKNKFKNVKIIFNTKITRIFNNKNKLTHIETLNIKNNKQKTLHIQGLFLAIGSIPNTQIFKKKIKTDKQGYIITQKNSLTNIPGIFAAGDVQDSKYKQAITSAGSGCIAALDLEKYLLSI